MCLAEGFDHHRGMGGAVLTVPGGAVSMLHFTWEEEGAHSLGETVSAETGANGLFNNKQAQ